MEGFLAGLLNRHQFGIRNDILEVVHVLHIPILLHYDAAGAQYFMDSLELVQRHVFQLVLQVLFGSPLWHLVQGSKLVCVDL